MARHHLTALATATLVSIVWIATMGSSPAAPDGSAGEEPVVRIEAARSDVCAVCGMFVARHPQWLAQVVYEDGSEAFFDGPKDLFKYLLAPERYAPGKRGVQTTAVRVTSYYDGAATPARQAFYVVGSDVLGPMGAELVPHRTREDAEEFARDHHGERIVRFPDVTQELLSELE